MERPAQKNPLPIIAIPVSLLPAKMKTEPATVTPNELAAKDTSTDHNAIITEHIAI